MRSQNSYVIHTFTEAGNLVCSAILFIDLKYKLSICYEWIAIRSFRRRFFCVVIEAFSASKLNFILQNFTYNITTILLAGVNITTILLAGVNITTILLAGVNITTILLAGVNITTILLAGVNITTILLAGVLLVKIVPRFCWLVF